MPPDVSARSWLALWGRRGWRPDRRPIRVLSRGTRQRLGLEAALGGQSARLILLDEPWEGLDPDASRWLSETLVAWRARGAAVVVSSHRIHDLAAVCDRSVFLVGGRLSCTSVVCTEDSPPSERADRLLQAFDRARGRVVVR